jgi:hypothetical protein
LRQTDFADKYMRLSIVGESRSIPVYMLGAVFDVSDAEADVIAQIFAKVGLARLDVASSGDVRAGVGGHEILVLHDLQHAFAESLCVDLGSTVSDQHARLLRSSAERFCGDGDALDPCFDWSLLCERRDCSNGKVALAMYMCDELVRHVLASSSDDLQDESRIPRILGLLCSYKWIRARGAAFEQRAVLRDFATAMANLAIVQGGVESGAAEEESSTETSFYGELLALETIAEVLQRISTWHFYPETPCEVHGERESGLAAELYGRLAVVKFEQLGAAAQRGAQNAVLKLRASIQESARPPWLLPRFDCYGSVERKDVRSGYGFIPGEGAVYGLAYVRRGGVDVLVAGGFAKAVLVGAGTSELRLQVMSGHENTVSDVRVADQCKVGASRPAIIASSSYDGTVRLWSVDEAGRCNQQCLRVLQSSTRERLRCVAITPDAQRVVAGGIGHGDSSASVGEAAPDLGKYRVHVARRGGVLLRHAGAGRLRERDVGRPQG